MFKSKYLKYKSKYLGLQKNLLLGGNSDFKTIQQFNAKFETFLRLIEHPIFENFQNANDVIVFAIGALSNSETGSTTLLKIYDVLDKHYYHKNIMLICIDHGDQTRTKTDLLENDFILFDSNDDLIEPTIHMFKKIANNKYSFMLINLTLPTNPEPYLVDEVITKCTKINTFDEYFEYILNHTNFEVDTIYSKFIYNIITMVNPEDIIFMNDMHFNSYKYINESANFISSVPVYQHSVDSQELHQIASQFDISLPTTGTYNQYLSFTNLLFCEMGWIVYLMKTLSNNYNVYIMEQVNKLFKEHNLNKLMILSYPKLEQKIVQKHSDDHSNQF